MTVAVVMALLIPSSGILRALAALFRHSCFSHGDELQKAARAGALCMVTETPSGSREIEIWSESFSQRFGVRSPAIECLLIAYLHRKHNTTGMIQHQFLLECEWRL